MSAARSQPPPSVDVEELLGRAGQLEAQELERFVKGVLTLRAKRIAPCLPDEEASLLSNIQKRVEPKVQRRFEELNEKRKADALSADELEELRCLTDEFEQVDAERAESLSKLAWLRNISLSALMVELGLRPPHYA